jgi:hypothetical protein
VPKRGGDYEDDEIVDHDDYMLWRATFGSTTDLRADGNANNEVDAADYALWRNELGMSSAWDDSTMGQHGALPLVDFGSAPRVANVIVSGSISVHAPYSFTLHDGGGEQLRTVPVGGADTISVVFTEDVNVLADDLRLVGLSKASVPGVAQFS